MYLETQLLTFVVRYILFIMEPRNLIATSVGSYVVVFLIQEFRLYKAKRSGMTDLASLSS
jgi:hypothetical protein